jgi:hypothetical protein
MRIGAAARMRGSCACMQCGAALQAAAAHPGQLQISGSAVWSCDAVSEPACGSNAARTAEENAETCSILASVLG